VLGRSQPGAATDDRRAGAAGDAGPAGVAGDNRRAGAAADDFASWWEAAGQGRDGAGGADTGGRPDWAVDPTDPRDTLSGS
jgi:hypothetical protein